MIRRVLRGCCLLVVALSWLSGCVSSRPWGKVGEFQNLLECGMGPDTVIELANSFEDLTFVRPLAPDGIQEASGAAPFETMSISFGGTRFELSFRGGQLEAVFLTWRSGIAQQSLNMRENICEGTRAAWLYIIAPEGFQFHSRSFQIDGVDLGKLPESHKSQLLFWGEAGDHLLRIFDEQGQPIGEMTFMIEDDLSKGSQYVVLDQIQVPRV